MTLETATGETMSLSEFYVRKWELVKQTCQSMDCIDPNTIDEVYQPIVDILQRSQREQAQSIDEFFNHEDRHDSGNWGMLLKRAYDSKNGAEEERVIKVIKEVHEAFCQCYSEIG